MKLIASGSQVLPTFTVAKGWECYRRDAPAELERLLSHIEQNDVRGVVLVSGDVHMGHLIRCEGRAVGARRGPDFWELTSSPLANDPWNESAGGVDPTLLHEVIDRTNYGVVDVDLDREGAEVILFLKDDGGGTLVKQPIDLASLRVR